MTYVLAPMAGFTNAAFRLVASHGGADKTYTEMVSAAGLAHGSVPTRHLLEILPGECLVACQLFGANPEELAFATREVAALGRFAEISLNAGCPVRRIVREGAGSALVRKPELVHEILSAMVAATSLPVTLKTRPGPRPDNVLMFELLDAAETAGVKGITLHARFTSQNHAGAVHLDLLRELVRRAKIPVAGNGGVKDEVTAREMEATGVSEIMVGRAALADPFIFARLRTGAAPAVDRRALFREHVAALKALHAQLAERFPQSRLPTLDVWVVLAARTHLFRYFAGQRGASELRRRLTAARTIGDVETAVDMM